MRSEKIVSMPSATPEPQQTTGVCEDHGQFPQKLTVIFGKEFKSACPECSRIRNEEEAARKEAQESELIRIRMAEKLGAALIPKRFAGKTFSGYIAETVAQERALKTCMRYTAEFKQNVAAGRCLLLLGKPGTGKTHLSVAIANEIMSKSSATAVYRTIGSVLQAIRATYDHSGDKSESQILSSLISPSLLILDEIGVSKEKPSDFELTTLFAIINGRYEELRPTVIVSNLDAKALATAIGERCADRLREGGVIVIPFEWESQRGKEGF